MVNSLNEYLLRKLQVVYDSEEIAQKAQLKFQFKGDAGLDLYNTGGDITIHPEKSVFVPSGLRIKIPDGYVGFIKPRSSTFMKRGLFVLEGTIDSGFTGPLFSIVWHPRLNDCSVPITIKQWERVSQLVVVPVWHGSYCPSISIERVDKLPATDRSINGFGSTGQ